MLPAELSQVESTVYARPSQPQSQPSSRCGVVFLSDLGLSNVQVPVLKRISLHRVDPAEPWQWSLMATQLCHGEDSKQRDFQTPQHLNNELQAPCAEHGWRCDLRADHQSVLLSR